MRARLAALLVCAPLAAHADPLRLRADALATTASPVGLVDLSAGGAATDWLRADAVVWLGSDSGWGDTEANVLVIAARAHDPLGRADGTLGRFVLAVGALRPLHLDGADAHVRLPHRFDVEAFAGAPVDPGVGTRAWDWMTGGRVARRLGDWGSAGVAYLEQRDHGELAIRELGLDAGGAIDKKSDVIAKLALDLISRGVAEAQLVGSRRFGAWKLEAYGIHRNAAHLLPATSLFSVLGDVASDRAGGRAIWHAAPRLDVEFDGGARHTGDGTGADALGRATLRLDPKGKGAVSFELRREGGVTGWTGVRGAARVPVADELTASTELELVRPDDGAVSGAGPLRTRAWYPWGLAAIGWRRGPWDAGVAIEASATPTDRGRVDVLARLSRAWEAP